MDSKYSYIDIAVSHTSSEAGTVHYSFNGAPVISLPTLHDISTHFRDLDAGYLMWDDGTKRSYSYFRLDESAHTAVMLVTLRMDSDVLMGGRQVINMLSAVKHRIEIGETFTDELMLKLAADSGFPETPRRSQWTADRSENASGVCCRTYSSVSELSNIFGFPRQADYGAYKAVLVVSASVTLQPDSNMPVITTPLDKSLLVVCPDGVTASSYRVELTDRLSITYSREGFEPVAVDFEVGNTNRYVHISGPALVVNNAEHAGIIFRMRVPYTLTSASGSNIDTYTILVNGRTANRNKDGFEVTNLDFVKGSAIIAVQSTNFGGYEHEFTPQELTDAMPLDIVLEPEAREVLIRLDFGDGRVMESQLTMEKNTKEYCGLRAGHFHGFRAYRLMSSKPETYNVDMKAAGGSPVASEVSSVSDNISDTAAATPVAPVMEKAASAMWEDRKSVRKAPEFALDTPDTDDSYDEDDQSGSLLQKKWVRYSLAVLIAVLIIFAGIMLFGGDKEDSVKSSRSVEETSAESPETSGSAASAVSAPPVSGVPDADELADIAYLNSNSEWKRSELKTDSYKALIDAISSGDIAAVAAHSYFSVKGRATNSRALAMIDMLWKSTGTPTEKSNVRALKKLDAADRISLRDVIKAIERYQPAEPNPAPRPGASDAASNQ